MGKGSTRKVRVKWTNLQDPNEFEYGYNHSIFKDPSAQPRKRAQKIAHQRQIAPLGGGVRDAVSNESGVLELYPSSAEVSAAEDEDDGSAGINSLNVGGNVWREDEALNSFDPRGPMAEGDQKPTFLLPIHYRQKMQLDLVDYVDLFFHDQLFSRMVEHTNNNMSDDSAKVTVAEMRRFVGIMFAMTLSPSNKIEDCWKLQNDGLIHASRFGEKLHMSCNRFKLIRKN